MNPNTFFLEVKGQNYFNNDKFYKNEVIDTFLKMDDSNPQDVGSMGPAEDYIDIIANRVCRRARPIGIDWSTLQNNLFYFKLFYRFHDLSVLLVGKKSFFGWQQTYPFNVALVFCFVLLIYFIINKCIN